MTEREALARKLFDVWANCPPRVDGDWGALYRPTQEAWLKVADWVQEQYDLHTGDGLNEAGKHYLNTTNNQEGSDNA